MDRLGQEPVERVVNAIMIALFAIAILMGIFHIGDGAPPDEFDECGHHRCVTIQVAGATI